jgi:hypothetical protein
MDTYLVECFVPGLERAGIIADAERVRAASAAARQAGQSIEYVAALLMPTDEVVFHMFHSSSAAVVRDACTDAHVPFERVLESEFLAPVREE